MATDVQHETVTLDAMVGRARALAPGLRERAEQTEQLRRLPEETVADFRHAGLFKIFQPARYGGYELDYGLTQLRLASELGRACGSSTWTLLIAACHSWIVGMFEPSVQEAVWGADADVLIASSFAPSTGRGRRVADGYVLSGDWSFSSGSELCDWIILGTALEGEEIQGPPRFWCLVPRTHWEILDTWYGEGLRGSSSNDVRVTDAFVPHEFTLDAGLLDGRPSPGSAVNPSFIYRLPLIPFFPFNIASEAIGIARGAIEGFVERGGQRSLRSNQAQQLRLSESCAEVDAAEALLLADAAEIARVGRAGEPWDQRFVAKVSRDLAYMVVSCSRAVNRLVFAVGAHGMQRSSPLQRAFRDIYAVANHGGNNWELKGLPFAQALLGGRGDSPSR